MPQGYSYLWNSGLVRLHLVSDALIALAYFTIPLQETLDRPLLPAAHD